MMTTNLFGDAVNNTPEITTFINDIYLNLKLPDQQQEEGDTKIDVMKIVDNINNSNSYVPPKKTENRISMTSKTNTDQKMSIRISNINNLEDMDEFIGLFTGFGSIKRTNILQDKGYGFITYHEHASALKAIESMNKYKYNYSILEVVLAK